MENFEKKNNENRVPVGSFDQGGLKLDGYVKNDSHLGVRHPGPRISNEKIKIGELNKREREIRVELHEIYGKVDPYQFIEKVFELVETMDEINKLRDEIKK